MTKQTKQRIINDCAKNAKEYMKYLEGKKIILVGPSGALIGKGLGEKIDSYDVVIRMNNSIAIPFKYKKDLGSRTDILYHTSGILLNALQYVGNRESKTPVQILKDDNIKFIMFKQGWNSNTKRLRNRFWKFVSLNSGVKISPIKKVYYDLIKKIKTKPNMGTLAITHILKSKCDSLTVVNCDFYAGKYYPGYVILPEHRFDFKERRLKAKDGSWVQKTRHLVKPQLYYLDNLWKNDKRLVVNKELKQLIRNKGSEKI